MANRSDRLVEILDDFVDSSRDVEAAAVVSLDGLPMASALPDSLEEDRLGAMAAALLSLGEQAAAGLGRGALSQVFVEGAGGYVFLMSARDQAVLAAITGSEAKIGLMLYQMRQAADHVGQALEPAASRLPGDGQSADRGAHNGAAVDGVGSGSDSTAAPAGHGSTPAPADTGAGDGGLAVPGPPSNGPAVRPQVAADPDDITSSIR